MSDSPYDNIESWQYRWAKWGRYAHMTPSEIHEETYKGGHSTEAYNGQPYLTTMGHIALMRRLGKVASYIVTPDNSLMLAKLVETRLRCCRRRHDRVRPARRRRPNDRGVSWPAAGS
jgi:hypothetical protein